MERLYQRLAKPMTGLDEADRTVWRYVVIYPNTAIDLYPDQVNVWQIRPDGPESHRRPLGLLPRAQPRAGRRGWCSASTSASTPRSWTRTSTWSSAVQTGIRTRGYAPGPLSAREAGVGWFADRIRADVD